MTFRELVALGHRQDLLESAAQAHQSSADEHDPDNERIALAIDEVLAEIEAEPARRLGFAQWVQIVVERVAECLDRRGGDGPDELVFRRIAHQFGPEAPLSIHTILGSGHETRIAEAVARGVMARSTLEPWELVGLDEAVQGAILRTLKRDLDAPPDQPLAMPCFAWFDYLVKAAANILRDAQRDRRRRGGDNDDLADDAALESAFDAEVREEVARLETELGLVDPAYRAFAVALAEADPTAVHEQRRERLLAQHALENLPTPPASTSQPTEDLAAARARYTAANAAYRSAYDTLSDRSAPMRRLLGSLGSNPAAAVLQSAAALAASWVREGALEITPDLAAPVLTLCGLFRCHSKVRVEARRAAALLRWFEVEHRAAVAAVSLHGSQGNRKNVERDLRFARVWAAARLITWCGWSSAEAFAAVDLSIDPANLRGVETEKPAALAELDAIDAALPPPARAAAAIRAAITALAPPQSR